MSVANDGRAVRDCDDPLVEFPSEADSIQPVDKDGKLGTVLNQEPLLVFAPAEPPCDQAMPERPRRRRRISPLARVVRQLSATVVALLDWLCVQAWRRVAAWGVGIATGCRAVWRPGVWTGTLSRSVQACLGRSAARVRATARLVGPLTVMVVTFPPRLGVRVLRTLAAWTTGVAMVCGTFAGALGRRVRAGLEGSATNARDRVRQSGVLLCGAYKAIAAWRLSGGMVPWRYQFHSIAPFVLGIIGGALLVGYARLVPDQSVTAFVPASETAPLPRDSAQLSVADPPERLAPGARPDQSATVNNAVPTVGKTSPGDSVLPVPKPERRREQAQPYRGSLRVTSTPRGAAVFINGDSAGTTPLVLRNLPVGSRAVRVSMDGYERWSRAVQVVANQRTEVNAVLTIPRRALTASIESE
jgi:hypothetical protein